MNTFKGSPLALPLTFETHQLSEGFSSIVYDAHGMAIDTHLSEAQAETLVTAVNAYDKHRALIETLTDALKPFAAIATEFLDDGDMANKADDRTVWGLNDHDVSYGDFRRAHAALAAAKEQSA